MLPPQPLEEDPMRLTTILTLPAASSREKASRIFDLAMATLAARLPSRLKYEVLISCGVRAFRSDEVVPDVTFMDVLERTPRSRVEAK